MIGITGWQAKRLLDFMDGEDEAELTLEYFAEERKDSETGEAMPPGLYAWFTEYPEEGSLLLAEKPADRDLEEEETPCPKRDDGVHCNCWYEGDKCCSCGACGLDENCKSTGASS